MPPGSPSAPSMLLTAASCRHKTAVEMSSSWLTEEYIMQLSRHAVYPTVICLDILAIFESNSKTDSLLWWWKGLGLEIEFIFWQKWIVLGPNKSLFWFLTFEDELLMSCRLCHFSSGKGENLWEKLYLFEFTAKILCYILCFLLIHCMNSWLSLVHCSRPISISNMVKAWLWLAEKKNEEKKICTDLEQGLPVRRNLMESL